MTKDEFKKIIEQGESVSVEFKECKDALPKSVFSTICAFLNRFGGDIFLGIKDDGTIIGVDEDKIKDIKTNLVSSMNNPQKIFPTIYLPVDEVTVDGKTILHLYVPESSQLHNSNGRIFDRNEDGDFDITNSTSLVANLYTRKQHEFTENMVFPYATMGDLREDLIDRVRLMATNRNANHPWSRMNNEEILRSSGLYKKDFQTGKSGYTLACILLFGKDETIISALPYHKTDAIYRVKQLDRYDDREVIKCNLLESFDKLMNFIEKHVDERFYLEGTTRVNARNNLFREVIANLLIHREYSNSYPAKLIIEKDCVKTENGNNAHGFGTIDPNNFTPYPKNPTIAGVFKEIGWADELGSGVKNVNKYSKVYSNIAPEFIDGDVFKTIVYIDDEKTSIANTSNDKNGTVNEEFGTVNDENGTVNEEFGTVNDENGTVNQTENLSTLRETDLNVLKCINDGSCFTVSDIVKAIGKSRRSIMRSLKILKDNGYIERVGSDKSGYWKTLK